MKRKSIRPSRTVRLAADHVDFVQLLLQSSRASTSQAALGRQSVSEPHRIKNGHDGIDWLATRRAFYAELAPQPEHSTIVDHLYVMKDCGIMTADQRAFASPFVEIAFLFRGTAEGFSPTIVVVEPSFGHRKKSRPFSGWAFGIKCQPSADRPVARDTPAYAGYQGHLQQALSSRNPISAAVEVMDRLCRDLLSKATASAGAAGTCFGDHTVVELATRLGRSPRTLQRRMKDETGLPPKRFLAVERFRHAVQEVPMRDARLSTVADEVGYSDQSHLTREFQRHAGLSPGAFQRTWRGSRGQTVRFVQDVPSATRLRMAVLATEDRGGSSHSA
jgi:AraC-like DNA-binding protein